MQSKPHFAADYCETCPDCGKEILLGHAGPVNMKNHTGKRACHKTQISEDKQTKLGMQTSLMKSYFKEPQAVQSTVMTPLTLPQACPPTCLPSCSPAGLPTYPPTSPPTYQPSCSSSSLPTCPPASTVLSKLSHVTSQLPTSIPVAKVEDPVAVLCGDPDTIISCLDDDEPYEWLDKKLNNVCGTEQCHKLCTATGHVTSQLVYKLSVCLCLFLSLNLKCNTSAKMPLFSL